MLRALAVVALSGTLAFAAVAAAQGQDGVTYDPDSPAGHEYALPIEQARGQAGQPDGTDAGGRTGSASEPREAPLFGVGIEPTVTPGAKADASPGSGSSPTGGGNGTHGDGGRGSGNGSRATGEETTDRLDVVPPRSRSEQASTGGLTAGVAAGIALAVGLLVRRRVAAH